MKTPVLWFLLILSDTSSQLLMKIGAVEAARSDWIPNGFLGGAYALYGVSFLVWMQLLKDTRLFIALSGASVVYVSVALASALVLGEPLTAQVTSGTLLIALGIFLMGMSQKKSPKGLSH